MKNIFEINEAHFSYSQNVEKSVLYVKNLAIPTGKIIFLLGASGSGKSTILEALGLMNNTLAAGKIVFQGAGAEPVDFSGIWKDHTRLYDLRRKSFSFIFQNTNLMENFTAYENISLSKMIQSGNSQASATNTARTLMYDVGLPDQMVDINKQSSNLSGGQRQRLSFVRALNSDFDILLCDEPTGNLDQVNARELFEVIQRAIGEKQKSAIVVSHDIDLALEYADVIIGIAKDSNGKGIIDSHHVYDLSVAEKGKVREQILQLYHTDKKAVEAIGEPKPLSLNGLSKIYFSGLFRSREGKALAGKSRINYLILTAIFFITFLAVGFSNGSFVYLEKKMSSPFVKWITVPIPFLTDDVALEELRQNIASGPVKSKFGISSISSFRQQSGYFFNLSTRPREDVQARGRTFEFTDGKIDPLVADILQEKNLVSASGSTFSGKQDLGVIVTSKFLKDIGIEGDDVHFLPFHTKFYGGELSGAVDSIVPIPIKAIVEDIPGKIDFGFTQEFAEIMRNNDGSGPLNPLQYNSISFHVMGDKELVSEFRKKLKNLCEKMTGFNLKVEKPEVYNLTFGGGYLVKIIFVEPVEGIAPKQKVLRDILANAEMKAYVGKITHIFDLYEVPNRSQQAAKGDYLTLQFDDIEKIEPFSKWLLAQNKDGKEYALEIDTSKVREKKNFLFLSQILRIIAGLLIIFSAVSISIFISNLLRMHLEKVKMNIGTFMAFGLAGKKVQNIYFQIIMWFILSSLALGLAGSVATGYLFDAFLAQNFVKEDGISFFKILDFNTLWISLGIFLIALGISWRTISKMLAKTPGDLIYNR